VRELNRSLGLALPTDGPKTLNGLILEHLQDIPEADVSIKIGNVPMEIVHAQGRTVKTVRIFRPPTRWKIQRCQKLRRDFSRFTKGCRNAMLGQELGRPKGALKGAGMATAAATARPKEIIFSWEGKDKAGKIVRGEMRAGGTAVVNATLRRQGILVTKVKKQRIGRRGKVTEKDVALFTRQLATMMKRACRCSSRSRS
jgi:hypothetical protein